jgi:tocopherol O-methyltransferase
MDAAKIREHYDLLSPYYESLWDKHIHHGYYLTGHESTSQATQQLIDLLLGHIDLPPHAEVLDIGCGVGATAIYLATAYNCRVTGLTISPEQVKLARRSARDLLNPPTFLVQDANDLPLLGMYDLVWTVEMISHLNRRSHFFRQVARQLKRGGHWCIAAWIKGSNLTREQHEKFITPIEQGMLVDLPTEEEYQAHFHANDLTLTFCQDISANVAKTWDIPLTLIKNPQLWKLAALHGSEISRFLRSFTAMQAGFRSGCFRYVVMTLQK